MCTDGISRQTTKSFSMKLSVKHSFFTLPFNSLWSRPPYWSCRLHYANNKQIPQGYGYTQFHNASNILKDMNSFQYNKQKVAITAVPQQLLFKQLLSSPCTYKHYEIPRLTIPPNFTYGPSRQIRVKFLVWYHPGSPEQKQSQDTLNGSPTL